jgi:hypothetical protein
MAHYAELDANNVVIRVIVGKNENEGDFESHYEKETGKVWKRTSYNTQSNKHNNDGTPFRGNYAGIGYTYHTEHDAFIPPKLHASWVLDANTFTWKAPVDLPEDHTTVFYKWNEETLSWIAPIPDTSPSQLYPNNPATLANTEIYVYVSPEDANLKAQYP